MSLTRRQLLEKQARLAELEKASAETLSEIKRLTRKLASIRRELQTLSVPEPPSNETRMSN